MSPFYRLQILLVVPQEVQEGRAEALAHERRQHERPQSAIRTSDPPSAFSADDHEGAVGRIGGRRGVRELRSDTKDLAWRRPCTSSVGVYMRRRRANSESNGQAASVAEALRRQTGTQITTEDVLPLRSRLPLARRAIRADGRITKSGRRSARGDQTPPMDRPGSRRWPGDDPISRPRDLLCT